MSTESVDVLIVGAGITGAGIARDAAMRGLRTAIVDQADFGSGTSSRSSRLVHGGLRYLEQWNWKLVFEASRERRTLLRIAPHLVRPLSFVFPIHRGSRVPLWKLAAGLTLYDVLAMFRNVHTHRILGKRRTLREEPNLRSQHLRGAGLYWDAQCDDARLTLATVRSAHRAGALAANYASVTDFERAEGRVVGARIADRITGRRYLVAASVVVNATGPWSDKMREKIKSDPILRPTQGVHVAVPRQRLGNHHAITLTSPIDGRVMFVIPWGEISYIGTTDTDSSLNPNTATATAEDVIYLLRSVNAYFPMARLGPSDVVSTWAGIRPLVRSESDDPGSVSREHRVLEEDGGLISVVGGKLTTYRSMAAEAVDVIARVLMERDGRRVRSGAPTHIEPLPGGEVQDLDVLIHEIVAEGFSPEVAENLVLSCGTESAAVVRLAQSDPHLAQPIVGGYSVLRAQLIHAMRREMAMTLTDLLIRRTPIFYQVMGHGVPEAPGIADLAADELGWDGARKASELASYLETIQRSMAFRDSLEDDGGLKG